MKKKVFTVALIVALIAIMVTGTLAYFTADDEVTNTFTIGSVLIEIYENDNATDKETMSFGALTPIVNTTTPSMDVSYIGKVVKVKNTGKNTAYVRTHLAIPTQLVDYLVLDVNIADGWSLTGTSATADGYTVYTYDYSGALAPDTFTPELLKGVYLASDVDMEEANDGSLWFVKKNSNGDITHRSGFKAHTKTGESYTSTTVNVRVAAQAIQTQGFNSAVSALNSGFGTNTNPWQ